MIRASAAAASSGLASFSRFIVTHLFYPEKPQDKRDHDEKVKDEVVQALLFPDEVPGEKAQEKTADDIISNHDPGHPNLRFR
jgi:hypothetical protein